MPDRYPSGSLAEGGYTGACPVLASVLATMEQLAARYPAARIPTCRAGHDLLAAELAAHGWRMRSGHRPVAEFRTVLRAAVRYEQTTAPTDLAALS